MLIKLIQKWHMSRIQKSLRVLYPSEQDRAGALLCMGAVEVENVLFKEGRILERIELDRFENTGYMLSVIDNHDIEGGQDAVSD